MRYGNAHGSTRQLVASNGTIVNDRFSYDAYGNAHGFTSGNAATKLLYSGEYYDSTAAQYYLRARWYNPANGRFNRMDPFAGNSQDPQTLHKYLYVHNNPINNIDPSGEFTTIQIMTVGAIIGGIIGSTIGALIAHHRDHTVSDVDFWKWTVGIGLFGAAIGALSGWLLVKFGIIVATTSGTVAGMNAPEIERIVSNTPRIMHAFHSHWQGIIEHWDKLRPIVREVLSKPQAYQEHIRMGTERATAYAAQVEVAGKTQWVSVAIYETGVMAGELATVVTPTAAQLQAAGILP